MRLDACSSLGGVKWAADRGVAMALGVAGPCSARGFSWVSVWVTPIAPAARSVAATGAAMRVVVFVFARIIASRASRLAGVQLAGFQLVARRVFDV